MAAREATMSGAAAIRSALYNTFFRRNSVYVATCVAAAYGSQEMFFSVTDKVWSNVNKGVSAFVQFSDGDVMSECMVFWGGCCGLVALANSSLPALSMLACFLLLGDSCD